MSKLSRAARRLARSAAAAAPTASTAAAAPEPSRNTAPAFTGRNAPARPIRPAGPRTPEGKAISSQNARKHGLTSATIHVPEDLREEYNTMSSSLQNELQPHGALEKAVFEHFLRAAWNIYRIGIFEDRILTCRENLTCEEVAAAVNRFHRYRTADERTFYKALKQLQELQTNRALHGSLAAELPSNTPVLTKLTAITKRTPIRRAEPRSGLSTPAPRQNYETNSPGQNQPPSNSATANSGPPRTAPAPTQPSNYETNSAGQNRLRSQPPPPATLSCCSTPAKPIAPPEPAPLAGAPHPRPTYALTPSSQISAVSALSAVTS